MNTLKENKSTSQKKRYLKTGDLVLLFSDEAEEEGYIAIGGNTDDRCIIKPFKDKDCVFKIVPPTQYMAKEALQRRNQTLETLVEEEAKRLETYQQLEDEANEALQSQLDGKFLVYGQIVQLQHKRTGKYISVQEHAEEGGGDDAAVQHRGLIRLEKEETKRCWFKIMPPLTPGAHTFSSSDDSTTQDIEESHIDEERLRRSIDEERLRRSIDETTSRRDIYRSKGPELVNEQEGEFVAVGDKIRLEHVLYGGNLVQLHPTSTLTTVDDPTILRNTLYELELQATSYTSFTVLLSDIPEVDTTTLKHGSKVRLFHPLAGYLYGEEDDDEPEGPLSSTSSSSTPSNNNNDTTNTEEMLFESSVKCKFYHTSGRMISYRTVWVVEDAMVDLSREANVSVVPDITWGKHVRLRRFGTSQYLCVLAADEKVQTSHTTATMTASTINTNTNTVATDVAMATSTPKETSEILTLGLTTQRHNTGTLWAFVPVRKELEQEVVFGSYTLLQSVSTKFWVHCSEELVSNIVEMKDYTDSELFCTRKFNYKDAFQIKAVPPAIIDAYTFVEQHLPLLRTYYHNAREQNFPENTQSIVDHLIELICFCTYSDTNNALEREGIPIVGHQKLLGKNKVLPVIVGIAVGVGPKQPLVITQHALKLLQLIAKANPKNGLRIAQMLQLNVLTENDSQMKYYADTLLPYTLLEVFQHNDELLYNAVTEEFVNSIFKFLTFNRDARWLDLLSVLCKCGETILASNQRLIARTLVAHKEIVPKRKVSGNNIEIKVRGPSNNKGKRKWMNIVEFGKMIESSLSQSYSATNIQQQMRNNFMESCNNEVHFFRSLLLLVAVLCEGRNYTTSSLLCNELSITYEELFLCLKNRNLIPLLRTAYCKCYDHLLADLYPQNERKTQFKRVWCTADKSQQHNNKNMPTSQDLSILWNPLYTLEPDDEPLKDAESQVRFKNPSDLQEFLLDYLFDESTFRFEPQQLHTGQPYFLYQFMILLRKSFYFGFFRRKERLLLPKLCEILLLDPQNYGSEPLPDEWMGILLAIKVETMRIIERYFEMKLNTILNDFFQRFVVDSSITSEEQFKYKMSEQLLNEYKPEQLTTLDRWGLCRALLSVLTHNNTALTGTALRLLQRVVCISSPVAAILKSLTKIQILISDAEKKNYRQLEESLRKMKELTSKSMNQEHVEQVIAILQKWVTLCSDDTTTTFSISSNMTLSKQTVTQKLCYNMGLHQEVLSLLHNPITVTDPNNKRETIALDIIVAAYQFLQAFALKSEQNQRVLFHHLDFMTSQMVKYREDTRVCTAIVCAITEIFRDNQSLSMKLSERQLLPFIELLFEGRQLSVLVEFFRVIIRPTESIILKANQNVLVKILAANRHTKQLLNIHKPQVDRTVSKRKEKKKKQQQQQQQKIPLVSSSPPVTNVGVKERLLPTSQGEQPVEKDNEIKTDQREDDIRTALVALLALTAEGKNYFAEVTAQKLLTLENCLDLCLRLKSSFSVSSTTTAETETNTQQLSFSVRSLDVLQTYLHFIDEVYFDTESSVNAGPPVLLLQFNKKLWDMFEMLHQAFVWLLSTPSSSSEGESHMYQRFFRIALSFVQHFFAKYFIPAKASQDQRVLASKVIDDLRKLTRKYVLNEISKQRLYDALSALVASTVGQSVASPLRKSTKNSIRASTLSGRERTLAETLRHTRAHNLESQEDERQEKFDEDTSLQKSLKTSHTQQQQQQQSKRKAKKSLSETKKRHVTSKKDGVGVGFKDLPSSPQDTSNFVQALLRLLEHHIDAIDALLVKNIVELMVNIEEGEKSTESPTPYLEALVNEIRNVLSTDEKLKLIALQLLCEYVNRSTTERGRRAAQDRLLTLDTPTAVLTLLDARYQHNYALQYHALFCLCTLLLLIPDPQQLKVNTKVRDSILATLTSHGTVGQHFISDVVRLLTASRSVIKDYKRLIITQQQTDRSRAVDDFGPKSLLTWTFGSALKTSVLPLPTREVQASATSSDNKDSGTNRTARSDKDSSNEIMKEQQKSRSGTFGTPETVLVWTSTPGSSRYMTHIEGLELHPGPLLTQLLQCLLLLSQGTMIFKATLVAQPPHDLLKELVQFLKAFEGVITLSHIDVVVQLFRVLSELVKLSPALQSVALRAQVMVPVNHILLRHLPSSCSTTDQALIIEKVLPLKVAVMEFLLTLTDGADKRIINKVTNQLALNVLEDNTSLLSTYDNTNETLFRDTVLLATHSLRLVQTLHDNFDEQLTQVPYKELHGVLTNCEKNCKLRIGRIEVLHQKQLHNIYFPIPSAFRRFKPGRPLEEEESNKRLEHRLFHKLEEKLIEQNVNWSRSTDKLEAFISWIHSQLLRQEQKTQHEKHWGRYYPFIKKVYRVCWNLSLIFAYIINLMILIAGEFQYSPLTTVLFVLCIVGLSLVTISTLGYFLLYGQQINQNGWRKHFPNDCSYILLSWSVIREHKLNVTWFRYVLLSTKHWVTNPYVIYLLIYLFTAVLGVAVSPLFFAFHLSQIFLRSTHLLFVLKAISRNILMLLLVLVVVISAIYMLSIFSFLFFQVYYNADAGRPCDTLLECTTTNIFFGLPSEGGLFEFVDPPDRSGLRFAWILFIIGFFFVVGVILLNVGLAVLVDTFAELRERYQEAKEALANSCFICSIEREVFQQKGKNFDAHLAEDHNCLHYFFFFAYLKEQKQKKNIKHLSQLEYAIYQKIKKNNMVSFFPVGRARVLEKDEESDSDSQREHELLNRLEKLERKMNQLTTETRKQSTESYLAAIYEYIRITSQHNTNQSSTPVNSKY